MTGRRRTVAILHQGEDIPSDEGYAPLRYGRLAEYLTARGHEVWRISPSFSHSQRRQREVGYFSSDEGRHVVVATGGYESSRSWARARFLAQFVPLAAGALRSLGDAVDVAIVGVPPPGLIAAVSLAVPSVPVIADVRDLWPDALAVGASPALERPLGVAGTVLAQELRLADLVTAVTGPMLERAPDNRRRRSVIPIGMTPRAVDPHLVPVAGTPLRLCFVSSHTQGFDFAPVVEAWQRYVAVLGSDSASARLTFIGADLHDVVQQRKIDADPTIDHLGRVPPANLSEVLAAFDVGLAPARPEWSHSVGNKVFDYLSSGLFVLHSIAPGAVEVLGDPTLARFCSLDSDSWFRALRDLHDTRAELRAGREQRIRRADRLVGREATGSAFATLIGELPPRR